ncbi:ABA4-like family protein [Nocardia sp. NPDC004722]
MIPTLFTLVFWLAAPFWAAMILAPRHRWTARLLSSPWIAVPPLLVYLAIMLPHFPQFFAAMTRPDLHTLRDILGADWGAAAIWAHLIGFDLFIGRWIYFDSRARSISAWLISPVLFVTILLSPIGLLSYLLLRSSRVGTDAPKSGGMRRGWGSGNSAIRKMKHAQFTSSNRE